MAKFENVSPEVEKIFDEVRKKTTIPHWVEIKVLCNDKQKNIVCKLVKSNELVETLTEGLNFAVIINEEIFDGLPDDMKKIAIDECLAGIGISESDALSINKEDFNTHTGVLAKYGHEKIIVLHESIKSLYDVQKQNEEKEKMAKAEKRKTGKKNNVFS